MTSRRTLAPLAIASLLLMPGLADAAIVEKWNSAASPAYVVLWSGGDLNEDGISDMITREYLTAGHRVGVRNAATGALQVQSAQVLGASAVQVVEIDADPNVEIIFKDEFAGMITCLTFTKAPVALTHRWSYVPTSGSFPSEWDYIDFDGNGQLYLMFREQVASNPSFYVYNHNGALLSQFNPAEPPTFLLQGQSVADFDNDGRQELLLTFESSAPQGPAAPMYFMFENNSPVAVDADAEAQTLSLRASFPNPTTSQSRIDYTVSVTGPTSLLIYDVNGREVRSLVNGTIKAGRYQAVWDGQDANGRRMPAGMYFYVLNTNGQRLGRQMVRLH